MWLAKPKPTKRVHKLMLAFGPTIDVGGKPNVAWQSSLNKILQQPKISELNKYSVYTNKTCKREGTKKELYA